MNTHKILHKRPTRMPFAPLTDDDLAIMCASTARHAMVRHSHQANDMTYRGIRLHSPAQFEELPTQAAVDELRKAFDAHERSPSIPSGPAPSVETAMVLGAVRRLLKAYE